MSQPNIEGSVDSPLNREPSPESLISSFLTKDGAYDRNHGPIPHIDASTHRVKVDGAVKQELSLSIEDLAALPQHEVIAALQCAGNRRHTMRTWIKEVDGIDWGDAAVMNCQWRGPRLRDVLRAADPTITHGHAAFASYQTETENAPWYGGSIDLSRGMSDQGEVILALERNHEPLCPHHGAPVRIIAPGIAGARSVKWLDRITVQETESTNHYQQRDYKVLPEDATTMDEAEKYWDTVPALQDMPINSVIISPRSGSSIAAENGAIKVSGYALPQGADGPIVKVEVSADKQSWVEATFQETPSKFSWALWSAEVTVKKGQARLFSRATDKAGNQQPENPAWNLRGVAYNGYGESRDVYTI